MGGFENKHNMEERCQGQPHVQSRAPHETCHLEQKGMFCQLVQNLFY